MKASFRSPLATELVSSWYPGNPGRGQENFSVVGGLTRAAEKLGGMR